MADRMLGAILIVLSFLGFISAEKVDVGVYYESRCPDSDSFFHDMLWPAFKQIPDYMNVELIPFGNSHYRRRGDTYVFSCQHGPSECYGNLVQTCFIETVNDTARQIKFVNCAFESPSQKQTMERCITSLDLRRQVKKCVTSPMGAELEYEMGKKTEALNPVHTFIPWITINGKGSQDITNRAIDSLMDVICDELTEKPDVCLKRKQNMINRVRSYYL